MDNRIWNMLQGHTLFSVWINQHYNCGLDLKLKR